MASPNFQISASSIMTDLEKMNLDWMDHQRKKEKTVNNLSLTNYMQFLRNKLFKHKKFNAIPEFTWHETQNEKGRYFEVGKDYDLDVSVLRTTCSCIEDSESESEYLQLLRRRTRNERVVKNNKKPLFINLAMDETAMSGIHGDIMKFQFNFEINQLKRAVQHKLDRLPQEVVNIICDYLANVTKMIFVSKQKMVYEQDFLVYNETFQGVIRSLLYKWHQNGNHQINFYGNQKMVSLQQKHVEQIGSKMVFINHESGAEFGLTFSLTVGAEAKFIDPGFNRFTPCAHEIDIDDPRTLSKVAPLLVLNIAITIIADAQFLSHDLPYCPEQGNCRGIIRYVLGRYYASHPFSSFTDSSLQHPGYTKYVNLILKDGLGRSAIADTSLDEAGRIVPVKFHLLMMPTLETYVPTDNMMEIECLSPYPSEDQDWLIKNVENGEFKKSLDPDNNTIIIGALYRYGDDEKMERPFDSGLRYGTAPVFVAPMVVPMTPYHIFRSLTEARFELYRAQTRDEFNDSNFRNMIYIKKVIEEYTEEGDGQFGEPSDSVSDDYMYNDCEITKVIESNQDNEVFGNQQNDLNGNTFSDPKMVCTNL